MGTDARKKSDGDILLELMVRKDVTQAALSRATGISVSHLSYVTRGGRRLGRNSIARLAKYFNVSPEVFFQ